MLDLPDAFVDVLEKQAVSEEELLLWLFEFELSTGTLRIAISHHDVTFDGQTYTANNGAFDLASETLDGEEPEFRVELQNLNNFWSDLVQQISLRGTPVTLRLVSWATLDDPAAQISYSELAIGEYEVDRQTLRASIRTRFSALGLTVPTLKMAGKRINTTSPEEWLGSNLPLLRRRN